ncbi:hypothetical protein GGF43_002216 [Coemansia sp. RSA 2618]|nr:hypothetical protein GGF43_002216 [Coemansia sp. RSA 2618]
MFINTLLFLYVLWYRKYPPIRAKNIKLIAVLYLSMLVWVTYRQYLIAAGIFAAIVAAYGIPLTVLHNSLTVKFIPTLRTCAYGVVFTELSFAIVWVGWATILVITYIARDINTSFKEYREMLLIVALSSISVSYQTIVHHIVREYTVHRWSRVTSTYSEYLTNQSSLFILLWVPVYNCMFHREEYRRKFFEKMEADGMTARYKMSLPSSSNADTLVMSQQPTEVA